MKMRTMYMHTLAGEPALFDGEQVCIPWPRDAVSLAGSLRQIRREQSRSRAFRVELLGAAEAATEPDTYGYVRVRVPADH